MYANRRTRYGPFSVHDYLFSPASPGQGPFFDLLENAPAKGLRLIRGIVEYATKWRREHYVEQRESFPRVSIRFPSGTKSFEGDWSVYHWARNIVPSVTTASALMALEAWGHRQIEAGRPFEQVLHDVLGPDGSSLAFVGVAIDLALSHWREACDVAWPMVATPELLEFDDARMLRDMAGVDRMAAFERKPSTARVKRSELDAKPSRRMRLSDQIGHYVFHGKPTQLDRLRATLEQARNEIKQKPNDGEDPINGLGATAERAVRMSCETDGSDCFAFTRLSRTVDRRGAPYQRKRPPVRRPAFPLAAPQFVSVQRVKPATRRGVAPTLPRKPPAQLPLSLTAFQPRTIPFHHIGRRASVHPIGPGKSGIAQVPTRCLKVAAGLHLGTVRTSFRNRTSAHGGLGGRGREFLLSVHSHMLQPACGFKLANDGHDCINRRCRPLGQDFNLSNVKLGGSNEIVEKTI